MIDVTPLTPALFDAWGDLFVRCHVPCYCRFWHFGGTKNEWLARCAFDDQANRADAARGLAAADGTAEGLVAREGDRVVGWMKLAPRARVAKLRNQALYRKLDLGPDEGVFSVGCFLIDPAHRRQGVARALLGGAKAFVAARGGRIIEAYPRRSPAPLHDEEAWMGPENVFTEAGFTEVFDGDGVYPVVRLAL